MRNDLVSNQTKPQPEMCHLQKNKERLQEQLDRFILAKKQMVDAKQALINYKFEYNDIDLDNMTEHEL